MKKLLWTLIILGFAAYAFTAIRAEKEPFQFLGKLFVGSSGVTDAAMLAQSEQLKVTGGTLINGTLDNPTYFETFGEGAAKGLATLQLDGTAFDGTAGVVNMAYIGKTRLAYVGIVGQTLDLAMTATGLDIGMDQTDNDGVEIFGGMNGASGRPFIIGTDPAFKFCATVKIQQGNGTDDFHVGFRRAEPVNATFDNYLDAATLGIVTVADPALIKIETIDDNGATTVTSTTDTVADTVAEKYCVLVSGAGVVTYTLNDAAPTATAAFTFDDGDPVIPFVQLLQANVAQTGTVEITEWEVAYQ